MARTWGWIPNLSGTAFDHDFIVRRLSTDVVGGMDIRFQAEAEPSGSTAVTVSRTVPVGGPENSSCGDATLWTHTFHVIDSRGMCFVDEDSDSPYLVESWMALRERLDGCSDTDFRCPAMDSMVRSVNTCTAVQDIADAFMSALESQTDYLVRVVPSSRFYLGLSRNDISSTVSLLDSNRLYFDSFLDVFEPDLGIDKVCRLRKELERRGMKADLIADNLMGRFTRFHSVVGLVVALAAVAIALTGVFRHRCSHTHCPNTFLDTVRASAEQVHVHDVLRQPMQPIDVNEASDDLENLIELADRGETITIVSGRHRAVLISESEHSGLMETLHLLSDPTMASDLIRARSTPVSEMTIWHPDEDGEGL